MRRRFFPWIIAASLVAPLASPSVARADPPIAATTASAAPAQTWRSSGSWGWFIVASGVIAGAALVTYGLTRDCADGDVPCQRSAAIAYWSGLGAAGLGTAVGVAVVQIGRTQVQIVPTAGARTVAGDGGIVLRGHF